MRLHSFLPALLLSAGSAFAATDWNNWDIAFMEVDGTHQGSYTIDPETNNLTLSAVNIPGIDFDLLGTISSKPDSFSFRPGSTFSVTLSMPKLDVDALEYDLTLSSGGNSLTTIIIQPLVTDGGFAVTYKYMGMTQRYNATLFAMQPNDDITFSLTMNADYSLTAACNMISDPFHVPVDLSGNDAITGEFSFVAMHLDNYSDVDFDCVVKDVSIVTEELIPEPATASLGLLGLAALMLRRRRA